MKHAQAHGDGADGADGADEEPEPLLRIDGLRVAYRTSAGHSVAVDEVGLRAEAGQITAVVGESGSGKSTTAHAVVGLLPGSGRIEAGTVRLAGEELTTLGERGWRRVRGGLIGLVPQDPGVALDPVKPVGAQVAEVLRVHHLATGAAARARAVDLLAEAGLPDPAARARQYPHELSGGMRQRVLIAMATAARPRLLVADEPTSALDVTVQRQILDHLQQIVADTGTGILLITHDLAVVADRADQVVVMSDAKVVESGPTERILRDPRHPRTRRLLADAPAVTGRRRRTPAAAAGNGSGSGAAEGTAADARPLLRVRDLAKSFPVRGPGLRRRRRTAVEGVSFDLARGRTLGLVGESGSGKTTTARMVLGLERPTAGTVELDGTPLTGLRGAAARQRNRRVQLIYQNPYASLNPRFTVAELLTEPLRNYGVGDRDSRAATVARLLEEVALPAGSARRKAAELSGGQRQRVAIARALALNPELVVCDEPVSALDVTVQARILELLTELQQRLGLSYLFISHDLAVVAQVSDTVAVMRDGRIVEAGDTDRVLSDPQHPYTEELLAAVPGRLPPPAPPTPSTSPSPTTGHPQLATEGLTWS